MNSVPLTEDEFRLLAYLRAYADHRGQSLDPNWVQQQLDFSLGQLQSAARGLVARGLAEFFEWQPPDSTLAPPGYGNGPVLSDIKLTDRGWDYLRIEPQAL